MLFGSYWIKNYHIVKVIEKIKYIIKKTFQVNIYENFEAQLREDSKGFFYENF